MSHPSQRLPPETLDWLNRVLTPIYFDAARTYNDVVQVLTEYPTLKVKTDVFTDERGQSQLLLCLFGTIPTVFGGNTYRIPVVLWVPAEYARIGPVAFVRPTESMLVNPGNHVDSNGKCYHPYLSYWDPVNNSISAFVKVLIDVFSKEPPVYAKPPAYQPSPQPPPSAMASTSAAPGATPPTPPKPPKPPKPGQGQGQVQGPGPVSHTPTPPQPTTQPPPPPPPPQMHHQYQHQPHSQQPPPPPPPPQQHFPDIMDEATEPIDQSQQPAPERPPNPEKIEALNELQHQIDTIVQTELKPELDTDNHALQHTEQTLAWMEQQLDREVAELNRLNAAYKANDTILKEKSLQAKSVIEDAKSRPQPDIDDVVCGENVVFNQLYDLVADEQAIEDTIYMLGKIHDKDKIQLEPFMRHTRSLAREQFLKKALINKICSHIGIEHS